MVDSVKKKPYHKPAFMVHGSVEKMTEQSEILAPSEDPGQGSGILNG